MDAILESTESDRFGYRPSVADVTHDLLLAALDEIESSRTFAYLPAASLTVMRPATSERRGETLGTLAVFRGGRIQWEEGEIGALSQDWRVPHIYAGRTQALALWHCLLGGAIDEIARAGWIAEQTRLCPICGFDLSHLPWTQVESSAPEEPPFQVPAYTCCESCRTTFGVDWIGATYGEMRTLWRKTNPALTPAQLSCLKKTPTDHPLSAEGE